MEHYQDYTDLTSQLEIIRNEKKNMSIQGFPVDYSATQIYRLRKMVSELTLICHSVISSALNRGFYTTEELTLFEECQTEISCCLQQINRKHSILSAKYWGEMFSKLRKLAHKTKT